MFPATRFTRAMIRPAATAQQLRWCLAARPRGVSSSNDNAAASATKGTKKPRSKLALYADLTKARLSSLVVVTSGAGFLAGGAPVDVAVMAATCVGTGLCAASAGAFNQILETSRDAAMNRTKQRPLPSGLVTPTEATAVGVAAGAAGTALLYTMANPTVAALGALNIALYAGPYTLSKRHTEWNTWIGSVVGAVPPVMGYAAASGGVVFATEPAALASLLFLWQFPHFFALSWMHREDYARGGFQMVAVNDPHGTRSADLIWEYSLYLTALPVLVSATGLTSWMFAVEGTAANVYLLSLAHAFRQDSQSNAKARKVFLCSLWYLPLLLAAYVFHSRVWNEHEHEQASVVVDADGVAVASSGDRSNDKAAEQHGVTLLTRAKQALRAVCVHEVVAAYNMGGSKDKDPEGNGSSTATAAAGGDASGGLCVKIKADKAVGAASASSAKAVAAAIDEALPTPRSRD